MTFRTSEVCNGIDTEMDIREVAKIFASCCTRLAHDGREAMDAFKKTVDELDDSDKGEAGAWMEELFAEEEA